ncbi:hypothetical protein C2S51_032428 [Perilla frutescens var. frutescens]|nr:hypothetical protein C2S51_032428 [Perilla frutescens var. frutescens]
MQLEVELLKTFPFVVNFVAIRSLQRPPSSAFVLLAAVLGHRRWLLLLSPPLTTSAQRNPRRHWPRALLQLVLRLHIPNFWNIKRRKENWKKVKNHLRKKQKNKWRAIKRRFL